MYLAVGSSQAHGDPWSCIHNITMKLVNKDGWRGASCSCADTGLSWTVGWALWVEVLCTGASFRSAVRINTCGDLRDPGVGRGRSWTQCSANKGLSRFKVARRSSSGFYVPLLSHGAVTGQELSLGRERGPGRWCPLSKAEDYSHGGTQLRTFSCPYVRGSKWLLRSCLRIWAAHHSFTTPWMGRLGAWACRREVLIGFRTQEPGGVKWVQGPRTKLTRVALLWGR